MTPHHVLQCYIRTKGKSVEYSKSKTVRNFLNTMTAATSTAANSMHPLVRDLYKRVIHVGKDYPLPMNRVRDIWKKAIRNPENCPSCYYDCNDMDNDNVHRPYSKECQHEIKLAVGKGRYMVREMIGIIQLKKYRTMKRNYDNNNDHWRSSSSSSSPSSIHDFINQYSSSTTEE